MAAPYSALRDLVEAGPVPVRMQLRNPRFEPKYLDDALLVIKEAAAQRLKSDGIDSEFDVNLFQNADTGIWHFEAYFLRANRRKVRSTAASPRLSVADLERVGDALGRKLIQVYRPPAHSEWV
jgi:hypothetical protein